MRNLTCLIFSVLFLFSHAENKKISYLKPGEIWKDTKGYEINAHGAGILYHKGIYYWYGEIKGDSTYRNPMVGWECFRTETGGVSCYSSKDLMNWKSEGVVLKPDLYNKKSDLHPSQVLERPKVIYNEKTKQFVMWLHVDSNDYGKASAGVAVSNSPVGNFKYLGSMQPNGQISRDMTLFKDDDGRAYHIYASEGNGTLHISLLSDDYLKPSGKYTRNFVDKSREAPAVFKRNGKYFMISSGCTGWDPNMAEYATADSILGKWTTIGNPCAGLNAEKTFYAQSTHVLKIEGKKNAYIAMFDRWNKTDLINSRYIWLPIIFNKDKIQINWLEKWNVKFFNSSKK